MTNETQMKIWVSTDAYGKCYLSRTLKEAKDILKRCNLGEMPKPDGEINGMKSFIGINQEDSYIQLCELENREKKQ